MIGKPKYNVGDIVTFLIDGKEKEGTIGIVDRYGTFFYDKDVCYDIMVHTENMFYKHIPETVVIAKTGEGDPNLL